jgi:serine/threonine-protein kinase RsbW
VSDRGRPASARTLCLRRDAVRTVVGELRGAVVAFAETHGASTAQRDDIALAVSEAISNVVVHAYPTAETSGPVTVDAWVQGATLVIEVGDEGRGMAPRTDSPGLGLGMPLMARLSEAIQVEDRCPPPGMVLRLQMRLA